VSPSFGQGEARLRELEPVQQTLQETPDFRDVREDKDYEYYAQDSQCTAEPSHVFCLCPFLYVVSVMIVPLFELGLSMSVSSTSERCATTMRRRTYNFSGSVPLAALHEGNNAIHRLPPTRRFGFKNAVAI